MHIVVHAYTTSTSFIRVRFEKVFIRIVRNPFNTLKYIAAPSLKSALSCHNIDEVNHLLLLLSSSKATTFSHLIDSPVFPSFSSFNSISTFFID